MSETIDFVLPWVNDQDPFWSKKRAQYKSNEGDNVHPARYRDWDLLKFLFRGIERFTPWVHKIWFVSDHQQPSWLNTENEKIRIVQQEDLLDSKNQPTFNINAIELNLHRIQGLSQTFVYLNDDMFFLRPISPSVFFRNGLPCDSAILSPVIVTRKIDVGSIAINDMCLINTNFNKSLVIRENPSKWLNLCYGKHLLRTICLMPWRHFPGFFNPHLPQPYLKATFERVWQVEPERLAEVSGHRFRNFYSDVNQWLIRYWQLCSGDFAPTSPNRGRDLSVMSIESTVRAVEKQMYDFVCINDDERIDDIYPYKKALINAFENILPEKSGYEK